VAEHIRDSFRACYSKQWSVSADRNTQQIYCSIRLWLFLNWQPLAVHLRLLLMTVSYSSASVNQGSYNNPKN